MKKAALICLAVFLLGTLGSSPRAQQTTISPTAQNEFVTGVAALSPTNHPPFPHELSHAWLAPDHAASPARATSAPLSIGVKLAAQGQYSKALTAVLEPITQKGLLADYATYYAGMAQLRLQRPNEALKTFKGLRQRKLSGYLTELAALGEAAADEALNDPAAAVPIYEKLIQDKPMNPDEVYMRLGLAAHLAHDRNKAADAFGRVYYEFALSDRAADAGLELTRLELPPAPSGSERYKLELGRAERLFAVKQYVPARAAYEALKPRATDEDRPLILLRLAECDYRQKRQRLAKDALGSLLDGPRQSEALYYYAIASRDLGDLQTFFRTTRRIADEFPTESWAEESLYALADYYVKHDDDAAADEVFRESYKKFPKGVYAERAAWKIGWRSYRQKNYKETIAYFEHASFDFPRSDFRPSWLYWSARAYEQLGDTAAAQQRYNLCITDYLNSYYGRLAAQRLATPVVHPVAVADRVMANDITLPAAPPPTAALIRALLTAELYDDALNELRYAQKNWGDSAMLQATVAWTTMQQAPAKSGMERLLLARGAMNTMKRAYPQFLTAGGEDLPSEVLQVIFPVAYWDLIRKYAGVNSLDPYLMAALVAQESTFVPDVKSYANAYGLMQLLPSTARSTALKLKLRYTTRALTDPEMNVRLGMQDFADRIKQFGEPFLALASYNAGDRAVRRWMQERPGLEREEFIDDIPYPETQNYVKRILGTADDYRRLYSPKS
ncbi:MAG TPA: transglycosylase SLT domain-containing protein [Vicinamibacterales bacterium]